MKTIVFLLLTLIGVNASQAFAENNTYVYTYTELASGSTIKLNKEKMQVILDNHNVINAKGCNEKIGYECIITDGSAFIFPTRNIFTGMSWDYNKIKFKVVKKVTRKLIGKEYISFIIQQQDKNDKYWYLFSHEFGLLAFGIANPRITSAFILQDKCGFAASNSCNN